MKKRRTWVKGFDVQNQYASPKKKEFISESRLWLLANLMTEFPRSAIRKIKTPHLESTTVQIWMKWLSSGHSELGHYPTVKNTMIMQRVDKLGLEVVIWSLFRPIFTLRKDILWLRRKLVMEDLAQLPTVRFTQEKDEQISIIQRTLSIPARAFTNVQCDRPGNLEWTERQMLGKGRDQAFDSQPNLAMRDSLEDNLTIKWSM